MKYSILLKAIALFLAACCLLTVAVCAVGIFAFSQLELYGSGYESFLDREREERAEILGEKLAYSYAARTLSAMPSSIAENYGYVTDMDALSNWYGLNPDQWGYAIYSTQNTLLESATASEELYSYNTYSISVGTEYVISTTEADAQMIYEDDSGHLQFYRWTPGPTYRVDVLLTDDAITSFEDIPLVYIRWAESWRYGIIFLLVGALALGAVCVVYLCCAAGRASKTAAVRPNGLNRLPLDLYGVAVGFADYALFILGFVYMLPICVTEENYLNPGMITLTGFVFLTALLLFLGWCFALTAQIKARHFYWWHHSAVGWTLGKIWKGIGTVCRILWKGISRMFSLLPLAGRRVLVVAALLLTGFFMVLFLANDAQFFGVLLLLALIFWSIALFVYDIYGFGTIMQGAKRMAEGDLTTKISTRYLIGSYKDHANRLNTMADVATVAAQKQMKSERMKAELITNVSHDIKTPLTSIINYADLLQKPHSEEEQQQYLEVLSRQSMRMKKLLEDLMEMSKASTGNIAVEIARINGTEAVNQALGEFADKLTAAQLTPVFKAPEEPIYLLSDGRLTWRVLSNVLSNAVKYALPGTRVYLDLRRAAGHVQLSIKNISREELNVTADELTERFVRGDTSRNTEGSGLGLNIAKSLMELQKGNLALTVDGDLFKVTLTFPAG